MVRRQSRRAADPQRGTRRRRDRARRARDERRAHEPGARVVRSACGDDAGRARPRRLLDARAAERGGGGARRSDVGARVHESDGRADPRGQARLGGRVLAADLDPAEAAAQARGGTVSRRRGMSAVRVPARGVVRRARLRPRRRLPRLALRAVAAGVPACRRRRGLGGRVARGLARLLVRGDLRCGRPRLAVAAATVRGRRRRGSRGGDGEPGRGERVSRGRLRPDAAEDPVHRQAADGRRAAAAEANAKRGASASATWTSSRCAS